MKGCPGMKMYAQREYNHIPTFHLYSICLTVTRLQMAAKMGGDQMPNMNSSSPVLDPSLYGFGGQKRSLDNGGKPSVYIHGFRFTATLSDALAFILYNMWIPFYKHHKSSRCVYPIPVERRWSKWPSSACSNCVFMFLFMSGFAPTTL